FLAISLVGFSIFALALSLLLWAAPARAWPVFLAPAWARSAAGSAFCLWLAYTIGLIAAMGVCLPSFYFYSLLAGIKISMLQVATLSMTGMAATSLMLLGILPIFVALLLGSIVFQLDPQTLQASLTLGLGLQFLAGLWGARSVHLGFLSLADTLPPEKRCARA